MKAKTSDVWVQEMFEAIYKRSNVKSSTVIVHVTLSWMPEVFPLIGGYEVLVGERLLIFSRRFAALFRGFQRGKSLWHPRQ